MPPLLSTLLLFAVLLHHYDTFRTNAHTIPLPPNVRTEGITLPSNPKAAADHLLAADVSSGDILLVNVRNGKTSTIVTAPRDPPRSSLGIAMHGPLVFAAGGPLFADGSGRAEMYVYDVRGGGREVATCAAPEGAFLNDVAVLDGGFTGIFAVFTDSVRPALYRLHVHRLPACVFDEVALPAAEFTSVVPNVAANGIAAFAHGVIISNSVTRSLYFIPRMDGWSPPPGVLTQATRPLLSPGTLAGVDGMFMVDQGGGEGLLYIAQPASGQVSGWSVKELYGGWGVGVTYTGSIVSEEFKFPSSVVVMGKKVAVCNVDFREPFSRENEHRFDLSVVRNALKA